MQTYIQKLACSLSDYAEELTKKCQEMQTNYLKTSVRNPEYCETLTVINPVQAVSAEFTSANHDLFESLEKADVYDPIMLNGFLLSEPRARFKFIEIVRALIWFELITQRVT